MSNSLSDTAKAKLEIPSVQEFCTVVPLYKEYDLSKCNEKEILRFEYFGGYGGTIDAYCLNCKRDSVFQAQISDMDAFKKATRSGLPLMGSPHPPVSLEEPSEIRHDDRDFTLEFQCTRNKTHSIQFYFSIIDNRIRKVGQYPSLADLHQRDISKYRRILGDKYAELAKAIGLHAHDVGIGSFVYLRRVFEHLIYKARDTASQETGWDEQAFSRSRMPEKIEMLAKYLPNFLVENANIYGILGKGVHELTEDECLNYFATVKMGIKLILDEEIARKEREADIQAIKNETARITGEIKSR